MTTTKRNLASANVRTKWVKSTCDAIRYWLENCAVQGAWTFERCLEWRTNHVHNHAMWQRISFAEQSYIQSRLDAAFEHHNRQLVWTTCLDGKRLIGNYAEHAELVNDNAFKIHQQSEQFPATHFSAYCWAHMDGEKLVLSPYRQVERSQEVDCGRLGEYFNAHNAQALTIHNRELVPLYV
jgi:hypothetical protein